MERPLYHYASFLLLSVALVPVCTRPFDAGAWMHFLGWVALFCLVERLLLLKTRRSHLDAVAALYHAFEPQLKDEVARDIAHELSQLMSYFVEYIGNAQAAEVALFDKETGHYKLTLALGIPRGAESLAMSAGAIDWERTMESVSPSILFVPIKSAGETQGAFRICMASVDSLPTAEQSEFGRHVSRIASVLLANGEYQEQKSKLLVKTQETVKAKTGFLANVSHDIRAPLTLVTNTLQVFLDGLLGELSSEQRDLLQESQKSTKYLLRLLGEVLDYAKIESGNTRYEPGIVDLKQVADEVLGMLLHSVEERQHMIVNALGESVPVFADEQHLKQILTNLLGNAIKYTEKGGTISLRALRTLDQKVVFSVQDSGVGISKDALSTIFEPFDRGNDSYASTQEGYGLGLALVKKLVQINRGEIRVHSIPGKGSTFFVSLPSTAASEARTSAQNAEVSTSRGSLRPVCLINLTNTQRETDLLYRSLRHHHIATDMIASLEDLQREREYSLYLIDAGENQQSVLTALAMLRQTSAPIIVLSSYSFAFQTERLLKRGASLCINKPYEIAEVLHAITKSSAPTQ